LRFTDEVYTFALKGAPLHIGVNEKAWPLLILPLDIEDFLTSAEPSPFRAALYTGRGKTG